MNDPSQTIATAMLFRVIVQPALPACPGTRTLHEVCGLGMGHYPDMGLHQNNDRIWGPWATIGLGLLVAVTFITVQIPILMGYLIVDDALMETIQSPERMALMEKNGTFLSLATIVAGLVSSTLVVLLVYLRQGLSVRRYLLLLKPKMKQFLPWFFLIVIIAVTYDFSKLLFDKPVVPEVMIDIYRSASIKPLFWLAIIVVGPIFEELFFRGFLFTGLVQSRIGAIGALLITASVWAVVHQQYELMDIFWIFIIGILLGVTRMKTGSLLPGIAIHMAMNLVATLELAYYA
ncbi:MAG TPA: CPBP family intramembrane metalloprotease [Acidiferrobacteraceae bacterium]|nr:CPBP family intramembrane metalloprotease [Acidiferrobacteraceae bacterium]HEX19855.1 CPBP family intramembrane metalloprotease [Acidiferrobacteraceae bacterium]